LLLVHGLMATGEIFGPVIDAFARRHTVDVPDLRGHGRSMHLEGPLTVEQHVRDLVRVIAHLDMLGTDILGYSQGGAVALQIAHDHSERVRRLVLVNTFAPNGLTIGECLENRVSLWALQLLGTGTLARILAGEGKPLTPEQARRLRETMASSNRKRSVEDPERARMWPW
jgi:pimeloyl-ACP methyl ester carboxylesterase